ncbi:MAG TPA: hypothetical protein VG711_00575 [Phycisphaerales bacterium]|nr:hypothetical protein [Phycisphaerales bacterium]
MAWNTNQSTFSGVIAASLFIGWSLISANALGQGTPAPANTAVPATSPAAPVRAKTPMELLQDQIDELRNMVNDLRAQLAKSNLERDTAQRQLTEIQQFLADHKDLGQDFEKYQQVKEVAEKADARKIAEEARARRAADQAEKDARRKKAIAARQQAAAQAKRVATYRERGFSPVGLDVYISKWAYFYRAKDTEQTRVDYDPLLGRYLRPVHGSEIEYSSMTISGSVLNGTKEVRNIGVAITFFDDHGQQVGHEIVEVANARPDVPYPFTSTIAMALNKPFDSSSVYVLYADPVGDESEEPSTSTGSQMPANDDASKSDGAMTGNSPRNAGSPSHQ